MTISLGNRAKMSTSTTGTGTITLGSAVSGFQTFADAGITNGQTVRYAIDDGANFEIGSGTYTSSGTTLTRSVTESSNSDSAISLSGSAEVFIAATVADLNPLYAANESSPSAQPSATGANAVAIGDSALAAGSKAVALGQSYAGGTNSFAAGNTTNSSSYGAIGANSISIGQASKAYGARSVGIGNNALGHATDSTAVGRGAEATGTSSSAYGYFAISAGSESVSLADSYASGANSLAAAIANNTSSYGATGANSVAIGYQAKASSNYDTAIGYKAVASGYGSLAIGTAGSSASGPTASGPGSFAIGNDVQATTHYCFGIGTDINVSHQYSYAIGDKLVARAKGQFVYGTGRFAADGDAQGSQYIIKCATTDATPTTMVTDGASSGAADNQVVATTDTCIMFSGTIVAMQNGAQDQGGWEIKGLLKNDGGTTTLVNSNVQTFAEGNSWAVALSADNTNNALKVQVTGEASHNIRWVANIQTSEVTYA